ncbi:MAG: acetylglutamate kinase [Clostridia bacterium]|nr:acetylglutamate kinase [Clostridia bacterium]
MATRTVVVKVGGRAGEEIPAATLARALGRLLAEGARVALVHGGGPAIERECRARGIPVRTVGGLRVTDEATLEVVREVLWGRIGPEWVAALGAEGIASTGVDGALVFRVRPAQEGRLGRVGEVVSVELGPLAEAWALGRLPVVTPFGSGPGPEPQLFNVNADEAAGALAARLAASELVFVTDVPGVFADDGAEPAKRLVLADVRRLLRSGAARDGMVPKLRAALAALSAGVGEVRVGGWEVLDPGEGQGEMGEMGHGETAPGAAGTTIEVGDPFMPLFRRSLTLTQGVGSRVWDAEGRRYLDFVGGIAVMALGYGHPEVVRAVRRQAVRLLHASNLYHTEPQAALARWLVGHSFADRVFFCNSGAEAVEAAIKLVRRYHAQAGHPERVEIVAFTDGFHGRTLGALAATGEPHLKEGFGPMPEGFRHLPFNDVGALRGAIGPRTAAVLVEPVQGEAGVVPAEPAFLRALREACDEAGALLVLDEVQTGVGRTGWLWAHEGYGVTPDVMTLAKALGGGLPLGAVLAREEVGLAFRPGAHGSTFGGNPVACAAALATLRVVSEPDFLAEVREKGERFAAGLGALAERHPGLVSGQRGLGLMRALVLAPGGPAAADVAQAAAERGLLVNPARPDVLRFLPPLTVREAEIDEALAILDASLSAVASREAMVS